MFTQSLPLSKQSTANQRKLRTSMLELAVWKAKMDESKLIDQKQGAQNKEDVDEISFYKPISYQLQAGIVIEHVLPYLLPAIHQELTIQLQYIRCLGYHNYFAYLHIIKNMIWYSSPGQFCGATISTISNAPQYLTLTGQAPCGLFNRQHHQ